MGKPRRPSDRSKLVKVRNRQAEAKLNDNSPVISRQDKIVLAAHQYQSNIFHLSPQSQNQLSPIPLKNPTNTLVLVSMGRISKAIRLTLSFYRNFCLLSILISLVCAITFFRLGFGGHIFFYLFWLKVVTMALIFYFINKNKRKEFYYFQNLGLSKKWLWISSLSFDFLLFIFCLVISRTI